MFRKEIINDLIRAAYQIAKREGKKTDWKRFKMDVQKELLLQDDYISNIITDDALLKATIIEEKYSSEPLPDQLDNDQSDESTPEKFTLGECIYCHFGNPKSNLVWPCFIEEFHSDGTITVSGTSCMGNPRIERRPLSDFKIIT